MAYITLLSDFGLQDPSAAIAKGLLMQCVENPVFFDISHEIQPFNIKQAAYLLGIAYKNFPPGTFHLPLFDLFSSTDPRLVLCEFEQHYFLVPDNGLLPLALNGNTPDGYTCLVLSKEQSFHTWITTAGNVIEQLKTTSPNELGLSTVNLKTLPANFSANQTELNCEVIYIDAYENVVINFTKPQYDELSKRGKFQLQFTQFEEIDTVSVNYNDVRVGNKLCRFNSNGYLEICINRVKAASLFGLKIGSKFNKIQISFQ